MSNKYPINKKGTIVSSGDYCGWNIEIKDETQTNGGYIILIWSEETNEGYDGWVGAYTDLDGYFSESKWLINWG